MQQQKLLEVTSEKQSAEERLANFEASYNANFSTVQELKKYQWSSLTGFPIGVKSQESSC